MTTRRAFLGTLAGGLVAAPLFIHGQTSAKVYRLGYLSTGSSTSSYRRPLEAFKEGLRNLGWIEGRNIAIEYRWAEGRVDRLPGLAAELVRLNVDVIIASPMPPALAARNATRTIPIVAIGVAEPVAVGLVTSLARPEGNVTGLTYSVDADIFGKQLQLLSETVPNVTRVAFLVNPGTSPALPLTISNIQTAARKLGLDLRLMEAREPGEFERVFATMTRDRAGAVLVEGDPMFFLNRAHLADLAVKSGLPSMSTQAQWVEAGGLISYGPNLPDLWRRGAAFVDRILKGAKPADLPMEQPIKFELLINLKTAKALRLTLPQTLLQRADQLIE